MLRTVAIAYRYSSAALLVSALEGADFTVFCPFATTLTMQPHLALALGGIPIQVPESEFHEASTYLSELHLGPCETIKEMQGKNSSEIDEKPPQSPRHFPVIEVGFWKKVANAIATFFFGVSTPWKDPALPQKDMRIGPNA